MLAISRCIYYNDDVKLIKLTDKDSRFEERYAFGEPVKVQGGILRKCGNALLAESGGRFKLFAEGKDHIKFLKGSGFFKWARGETRFSEGDMFLAESTGEYEINGKCSFLLIRE